MSVIISLDTSTPMCCVSIHRKGEVLATSILNGEKSHANKLLKIIDQLLALSGVQKKEIEAIALAKGPGSYTGLRIGTSTAKGLCYALGIPLIGINTLEVMAFHAFSKFRAPDWLYVPMLDARRMEVYCLFMEGLDHCLKQTHALVLEEDSFKEYLDKGKVVFFGNGALKARDLYEAHPNALFIDREEGYTGAMGELAFERFKKEEFEDVAYFEPYYLKEFQAIKPKKLV